MQLLSLFSLGISVSFIRIFIGIWILHVVEGNQLQLLGWTQISLFRNMRSQVKVRIWTQCYLQNIKLLVRIN